MSATILLVLRILIGVVLYLFLGIALWTFWQDLRKRGRALVELRIPALTLEAEGENDQSWRYTQPQVLIGRDLACECRIDDTTISARHARLSYHHGQWWVEDLHSRNGTLLNQQPVVEQVVLTSEDFLQCGRVIFRIYLEEISNRPQ